MADQFELFEKQSRQRKAGGFYSDDMPSAVEDEHLFRRWQAGEFCIDLARERNCTEQQMIGIIARIWRKLGRQ